MSAYLATGGLWESKDSGARFIRVREDNVLFPTALGQGESTRLHGVDINGLVGSDDGGRTWTATAYQGSTFAIAATADGKTVGVVSRETDFFRSSDGGATWPGPD